MNLSKLFHASPFSSAARGRNVAPDLWPEMLRIIGEVQPSYVFAENVKRSPIERAASDLRRLGFACRFGRLSASDVGAPHRRDRWWLRGDAHSDGESVGTEHGQVARMRAAPGRVWGASRGDTFEWLMGWPVTWTALDPLATDRYRSWPLSHGMASPSDTEKEYERDG